MKRTTKILLITAVFLIALTALWSVGKNWFLNYVATKLEQQLYSLKDAGYLLKYDSIKIDLNGNNVKIYNFSLKSIKDSINCLHEPLIAAKIIEADGMKLFPLIAKKQLRFNEIIIDSSALLIDNRMFKNDTTNSSKTDFSITVKKISLPTLKLVVQNSEKCKAAITYRSNITIENLILAFYPDQKMYFNIDAANANNISIVDDQNYYTYRIKEIDYDKQKESLKIDSVKILPAFSKYEFSRKVGYETDRFHGMIPYFNVYGLKIPAQKAEEDAIQVKKITTQLLLDVYRDKRVVDKPVYKALPQEQLKKLSLNIRIDSLILNKSNVRYEEYGEESDSAGYVHFTHLFATMANISNLKEDHAQKATLIASGKFMDSGQIYLKAIFPHDARKSFMVTGNARNMDMTALNPMLKPNLKVKIESGLLDKFSFSFSGNNAESAGEVELNYHDLKLITFSNKKKKGLFDKDGEGKTIIAGLKTFIVNTFIIRKDMDDEKLPEEKRTGTISFERDKHKYIFNYWWKSVASGIKSAYKIDKLEDSRLIEALKPKDKN